MLNAKNIVIAASLAWAAVAGGLVYAQVPATPPVVADQTDSTPSVLPDLGGVVAVDPDTHKITVDVGLFGSRLIEWFVATFGGIISLAVAGWLVALIQKLRIQASDALRARFQQIILSGLSIGAAKAEEKLQGAGKVEIKNEAAAVAVKYVQDHGAETAKKLGLDVKSEQAVEAIRANIEKMVNDPAVPTPTSIGPEKTATAQPAGGGA